MGKIVHSFLLVALTLPNFGWTDASAATSTAPDESAGAVDCSAWTLDGYHLGMRGEAVLAVRSVTLHVAGQAQASEPGRFNGVLILDGLNRVTKWDAVYQTQDGAALRAEIQNRLGEPTSDVSGNIIENASETVRQRRTIWWSTACDIAIIVYENTTLRGTPGRSVQATLTRVSLLPPGIANWKTLFH